MQGWPKFTELNLKHKQDLLFLLQPPNKHLLCIHQDCGQWILFKHRGHENGDVFEAQSDKQCWSCPWLEAYFSSCCTYICFIWSYIAQYAISKLKIPLACFPHGAHDSWEQYYLSFSHLPLESWLWLNSLWGGQKIFPLTSGSDFSLILKLLIQTIWKGLFKRIISFYLFT